MLTLLRGLACSALPTIEREAAPFYLQACHIRYSTNAIDVSKPVGHQTDLVTAPNIVGRTMTHQ